MKTRRVNPILELNNDVYTYKDRYIELAKYLENIIETKQQRLKQIKNQFLDSLIKLKTNINKAQMKKQHKNNSKKQVNPNLKIQAGCDISYNSASSIDFDQSHQLNRTQSIKTPNNATKGIKQNNFNVKFEEDQQKQKESQFRKHKHTHNKNRQSSQKLIELDQKTKNLFKEINQLTLQIHKLYQQKEGVINQIYDQINNKQTKLKKVLDKVNNEEGLINASKLSFIFGSISLKNSENQQNNLQNQINEKQSTIKKEYSKSLILKNQVDCKIRRGRPKKKSNSALQKNQEKISRIQQNVEKSIKSDDKKDKTFFKENQDDLQQQINMQLPYLQLQKPQKLNQSVKLQSPIKKKTKNIQSIPRLKLTLNNTDSFTLSRTLQNTSIVKGEMIRQTKQKHYSNQNRTVNRARIKKMKENQFINLISSSSGANSQASEDRQFMKNIQTQSKNHDSDSKHQLSESPLQSQLRASMKKNIIKRKKMLKYIEILD